MASSSDEIAESRFGSNQLLVREVHMRLNPMKTKSIGVSRSRTSAACYSDLTLGGTKFREKESAYSWGNFRL